jgi:hypothetical protein
MMFACFQSLQRLMSTCSHGRVDILDIITLGEGALVASETSLGKLVDTLVDTGSTRLDHVEYAAFIGSKSSDLTDNGSDHRDTLSEFLMIMSEYSKRK